MQSIFKTKLIIIRGCTDQSTWLLWVHAFGTSKIHTLHYTYFLSRSSLDRSFDALISLEIVYSRHFAILPCCCIVFIFVMWTWFTFCSYIYLSCVPLILFSWLICSLTLAWCWSRRLFSPLHLRQWLSWLSSVRTSSSSRSSSLSCCFHLSLASQDRAVSALKSVEELARFEGRESFATMTQINGQSVATAQKRENQGDLETYDHPIRNELMRIAQEWRTYIVCTK